MAYTETKSKSVKQIYTGQDPKTNFSRFIGSAKSSRGRKAASSTEKSYLEQGIKIIKRLFD